MKCFKFLNIVLLCFSLVNSNSIPSGTGARARTVVLLGEIGAGKSLLGSYLLGMSKDTEGCFKIGHDGSHSDFPTTQEACMESGHYLGQIGKPIINIVDTPGFVGKLGPDSDNMKNIVEFLRKNVNEIHAFVIVINAKEPQPSLSAEAVQMFQTFEDTFGTEFWQYAILQASHWSVSESEDNRRKSLVPMVNADIWKNKYNILLADQFPSLNRNQMTIPATFIHPYYNWHSAYETKSMAHNLDYLQALIEGKSESYTFMQSEEEQKESQLNVYIYAAYSGWGFAGIFLITTLVFFIKYIHAEPKCTKFNSGAASAIDEESCNDEDSSNDEDDSESEGGSVVDEMETPC